MYLTSRRFWIGVLVLAVQGAAHGALGIMGVDALNDDLSAELVHIGQAALVGALIAAITALATGRAEPASTSESSEDSDKPP